MNQLPSIAIGGKAPLEIWSGRVARDHGSLRVFGCPATVDSSANKLVFLGYKKDLKGYKLWDPKTKKFVLSGYVTLHEDSVVKPTVSRQVQMGKIKSGVSQRVMSYAAPQSPSCSISVGFSLVVTPVEFV